MLIPIGDNLQKNSIPVAGIIIICLNFLVGAYEFRLFQEDPEGGSHLSEFFYEWGLVPDEFARGSYHGLFTCMFLHGDLMHLLGNMFMLWIFLGSLEAGLGSFGFVVLYLLSGLAAGIVQIWFTTSGTDIPIIGASGAIFGVVGAYLILFGPYAKIHLLANFGILTGWRFIRFSMPAGAYLFFFVLLDQIDGIAGAIESGESAGVAWFAHAGGFAAGAVLMLMQRDFALQNVRRNKEGQIEVGDFSEKVDEKRAFARRGAVLQTVNEMESCPYCQTSLAEAERISATMFRCNNGACARLVYITEQMPADPKQRSTKSISTTTPTATGTPAAGKKPAETRAATETPASV